MGRRSSFRRVFWDWVSYYRNIWVWFSLGFFIFRDVKDYEILKKIKMRVKDFVELLR